MRTTKKLTTIQRIDEIPAFTNEAEEHAFWATHELSSALWDQAQPLAPGELPPSRTTSPPGVALLRAEKAAPFWGSGFLGTLFQSWMSGVT